MTQEMNKPDWHSKWWVQLPVAEDITVTKIDGFSECRYKKQRKLDDWIKPFFDNCCRMEKIEK